MLRTIIGPEMSVQPVRKGVAGSTSSSVAETDMTLAGMPAMVTATGARNPCPKMVTGVNGWSTRCKVLSADVTCTFVTKRKPFARLASSPELISCTRTVTVAFKFGRPAPEAGGVRTMIWLNETESTCASTGPKKTWSGATKPEPMIVTRVFPSFVPADGSTAVIVGVLGVAVPKAKQFGRDTTTGAVDLVPNVRVMEAGTDWGEASGKDGVTSVTD